MTEIWKDIPGYEGRYQASTEGRIRSIDHFVPCAHGGQRLVRGRILRPSGSKRDPHLYVVLGHKAPGSPVHRLIATTFIGPRPNGYDIRHLDGNPTNNKVSNLAYGTRTENILDVLRIGERWRKLTLSDAMTIRRLYATGRPAKEIAAAYGISEGHTYRIIRGDCLNHDALL